MIVHWTVAGVELVGIYDVQLGRWKWGPHGWSWQWMRGAVSRKGMNSVPFQRGTLEHPGESSCIRTQGAKLCREAES